MLATSTLIVLSVRAIGVGLATRAASVNVFKTILWNILRRPMSFFDTTPSGMIITRCTSDLDELDFNLPAQMSFFLNTVFNYIGTLVLAAFFNWIIIIFILAGILLISKSLKKYMITTIELKRLIKISCAPMLSLGNELIDGVVVIRNYNQRQNQLREYQKKADLHHRCLLHDQLIIIWLRLRIEGILVIVVSLALFSFVASR